MVLPGSDIPAAQGALTAQGRDFKPSSPWDDHLEDDRLYYQPL